MLPPKCTPKGYDWSWPAVGESPGIGNGNHIRRNADVRLPNSDVPVETEKVSSAIGKIDAGNVVTVVKVPFGEGVESFGAAIR